MEQYTEKTVCVSHLCEVNETRCEAGRAAGDLSHRASSSGFTRNYVASLPGDVQNGLILILGLGHSSWEWAGYGADLSTCTNTSFANRT